MPRGGAWSATTCAAAGAARARPRRVGGHHQRRPARAGAAGQAASTSASIAAWRARRSLGAESRPPAARAPAASGFTGITAAIRLTTAPPAPPRPARARPARSGISASQSTGRTPSAAIAGASAASRAVQHEGAGHVGVDPRHLAGRALGVAGAGEEAVGRPLDRAPADDRAHRHAVRRGARAAPPARPGTARIVPIETTGLEGQITIRSAPAIAVEQARGRPGRLDPDAARSARSARAAPCSTRYSWKLRSPAGVVMRVRTGSSDIGSIRAATPSRRAELRGHRAQAPRPRRGAACGAGGWPGRGRRGRTRPRGRRWRAPPGSGSCRRRSPSRARPPRPASV